MAGTCSQPASRESQCSPESLFSSGRGSQSRLPGSWQVPNAATKYSPVPRLLLPGRNTTASAAPQSGGASATRDGPHVEAFLQLGASIDAAGGQDDVLRRDISQLDIERILSPRGGAALASTLASTPGWRRDATPGAQEPISMSFSPQVLIRSGNASKKRVNYFGGAGRSEAPSPAGAISHTPVRQGPVSLARKIFSNPAAGFEMVASLSPRGLVPSLREISPVPSSARSTETPAGSVAGTARAAQEAGVGQPLPATPRLSQWSSEKIARGEY
jgi:hypothetical protein